MIARETTADYLRHVPAGRLQLVLVGKDPFPTEPTGIPFCKSTWRAQRASNCSGLHVLLSLGVDPAEAEAAYATPSDLFKALRAAGIVLLNVSYDFIGGPLRRSQHGPHLVSAYALNRPVLQAADSVLYCGEAGKIRWIAPDEKGECIVHPDVRNRHNPRTAARWAEAWGRHALRDRLGLVLPAIGAKDARAAAG